MSPKVIRDSQEPRSNNIKNVYIQKITSLMKISKDTIGKSEIEALNQTNRKKIKKNLSQAQKNNIRLQKNRQSAKKARQRKKIYVKLLEQQQARLSGVLQKTQLVEKASTQYVDVLSGQKKQLTQNQNPQRRKSSDGNINTMKQKKLPTKTQAHQLQDKIVLLKQIVEELTELSKYAYWKQTKSNQNNPQNIQSNQMEEDFFNIEQVLADIQVIQMQHGKSLDINFDDLLNAPYQDESLDQQRERYDIKTLIGDQYQTVSRCLIQLESINSEAQALLKSSSLFRKDIIPSEDFKNSELQQFKKKNTIVPEYQIKKIKPRRIDSLNSLSSANRSIVGKNHSLFSLNNYFINMEQAERKILDIDRAIEEISRILAFKQEQQRQEKDDDLSGQKF